MSPLPAPVSLNSHHRETLRRIFQHPASHNIEWPDVASLLNVVGTMQEHRDGRFEVRVGTEVQFLERPRHKDIDVQQVVDLRRMLTSAGYHQLLDERDDKGTGH